MGDRGRSKIQGKKVREHSRRARSGEQKKETWKKGSEFAGRRRRRMHLSLDQISAC